MKYDIIYFVIHYSHTVTGYGCFKKTIKKPVEVVNEYFTFDYGGAVNLLNLSRNIYPYEHYSICSVNITEYQMILPNIYIVAEFCTNEYVICNSLRDAEKIRHRKLVAIFNKRIVRREHIVGSFKVSELELE